MDKKNKRKRHYRAMAFGNKKSKLSSGKNVIQESLQGFILVSNGREKEAIREAYKLLNEIAESKENQGKGKCNPFLEDNKKESEAKEEEEEEEDIETALAKERVELSSEKKFQLCYTAGVSNFMFVKSLVDPLPIATSIIESIQKDGQQRTRYLIRLIPIHTTCKAFSGSIQASVEKLIGKLNLKDVALTYCVAFKSRYNNNLLQIEALNAVNEAVRKETNGKWAIKLKESDYVVVLEVVTSYCCIGILPKYFQLKKYNLIELAKASQQTCVETTIEAHPSPVKTEESNGSMNNDSEGSPLKEKEEVSNQDEAGSETLKNDDTKVEGAR